MASISFSPNLSGKQSQSILIVSLELAIEGLLNREKFSKLIKIKYLFRCRIKNHGKKVQMN